MSLEEIVASFLYILSHHFRNRTVGKFFYPSLESVSRNFNACLLAVLKLNQLLLKKPEPIPEDCTDGRLKYFKNCLGALDGTHIRVTAPAHLKGRYRSRLGDTHSHSVDTSTSSKRQKKVPGPRKAVQSDPIVIMLEDVNGQLNVVTQHVGTMAAVAEREAALHEKAIHEDPNQKMKEMAISELARLGFTGSETVDAALIFTTAPEKMNMMLALPGTLRRDHVLKMLKSEEEKEKEKRRG